MCVCVCDSVCVVCDCVCVCARARTSRGERAHDCVSVCAGRSGVSHTAAAPPTAVWSVIVGYMSVCAASVYRGVSVCVYVA